MSISDVMESENNHLNACYNACRDGDLKRIDELFTGCQNQIYFSTGITGAHESRNFKIMKLLLDKGATDFELVLIYAASCDYVKLVKRMMQKPYISIFSALYNAAMTRSVAVIKLLIKLNGVDYSSGLKGACEGGRKKIVELMLDRGRDYFRTVVYMQGVWFNALNSAFKNNHHHIMMFLINSGADKKAIAKYMRLYLIEKGYIKYLIRKKIVKANRYKKTNSSKMVVLKDLRNELYRYINY